MYFFFFQAEDGIRDYKVTGVQTCALPILRLPSGGQRHLGACVIELAHPEPGEGGQRQLGPEHGADADGVGPHRLERLGSIQRSTSSNARVVASGSSSISQCETPGMAIRFVPGKCEARNGLSSPSASMAKRGPANFRAAESPSKLPMSPRSATKAFRSMRATEAKTAVRVAGRAFGPSISP